MTSTVSSYSPGLSDPAGSANGFPQSSPSSTASAGSATDGAARSVEAVTLTPDAQNSSDLLEAARAASGVDHQAVQSLRSAIGSGAYNVPTERLAASIVAAMTEIRS